MSSATVSPSSAATAQPSLPTRSTSTSSGSSSCPATRKRPPRAPRNRPPQRRAHVAQLLAELRPEHGQVRLHAQLASPRPRRTRPPSRAAPRRSRRRARGARRALRRRAGAAAAAASARTRRAPAGRARRRAAPPPPRRAASSSGVAAPPASRRGTPTRPSRDEVAPQVLREERHHRRDHLQRGGERVPERAQRRRVALPEAPARAADVPVRQIVEEGGRTPRTTSGVQYRSYASVASRTSCGRARGEPAVERLQLARSAPPARSRRCSRT